MPKVILLEPFMRHYAGSVFALSDETDIPDWPEEEILREKQNFANKRCYFLPDAGSGRPEFLPLSATVLCPEAVFDGIALNGGPCRITSVSPCLEDAELDRSTEEGRGKARLAGEEKNRILIALEGELELSVTIRPNGEPERFARWNNAEKQLDCSACTPGFYEVHIRERSGVQHSFTMIKCFPLVVQYDARTRKYPTMKTIW